MDFDGSITVAYGLPSVRGPGSIAVLAATLLAFLPVISSAKDAWRVPTAGVRAVVAGTPAGEDFPGALAGVVQWYHGGLITNVNGVRVLSASGKPCRRMIMQSGPGTFIRIAFEMFPDETRYYIYYDDPTAGSVPNWTPRRGVILETLRYNGGYPGSERAMLKIIRNAGARYGRGFVDNVFHGFNVFGDDNTFISIYRGWFFAKQAGEYTFCTSSDDASFLYVDGDLITAWPGAHGARPRAKFTGDVQLSKGVHKLEYLHVNLGGPSITVAAWKPPWGKKVWPMQKSDFLPVASCRVTGIETRNGASIPGMALKTQSVFFLDDKPFIRVRFTALASVSGQMKWDFGDGQKGAGNTVDHIYCDEGIYDVTVSVAGAALAENARGVAKNRIRITRDYTRQNDYMDDNPYKLAAIFDGYNFDAMPVPALMRIAALYHDVDMPEKQRGVYRAVLKNARAADHKDDVFTAAQQLAVYMRDAGGDPTGAIDLLRSVETHLGSDINLRAKIKREIGDVYYFYLHDLDRARDEYDQVVGRYAGLEDNIVRLTKIRIGDIYREKGDYGKAVKNYTEAEKYKLYEWPAEQLETRRGMMAQAVEQLTAQGKFDEAQRWVNIWEWEFPLDKLRGPLSLASGKIAFRRAMKSRQRGDTDAVARDFHEAAKRFILLPDINPADPSAAECLYQAARCFKRIGDMAKVRELLKRITDNYPDDPRHADAESVLKKMK